MSLYGESFAKIKLKLTKYTVPIKLLLYKHLSAIPQLSFDLKKGGEVYLSKDYKKMLTCSDIIHFQSSTLDRLSTV